MIWSGLQNGSTVEYESHENLYIADPQGAGHESLDVWFWVE